MSKTIVLIYKLPTLYEILHEINDLLNFELQSTLDEIELKNIISDKKKTFVVISETKISEVQGDNNIILSKFPIKFFNLIEKINIILLKKNFITQSKININDYQLDVNSRALKIGKKKLKLTQKETEIIFFIKNSNKEVSISSLKKNVWGHSSELESHTVETHVYRLRKKIKDFFIDSKFIKSTENGKGSFKRIKK